MERKNRRAGNVARSRLSGGSGRICTRPHELLWCESQTSLHRILLYIRSNAIELRTRAHQTIEAFLLPKWATSAQEKVSLVSSESLERAQPFGGEHVRRRQKMNMIRHHDESMELIPVQCAFSMPQRRHDHLCNFRPAQRQGAEGACVQEPVDGYERFARGDQCGRWEYPACGKTAVQSEGDEQRLIHYVKMWQPPFIMPHTSSWCVGGGETLTASSRLKAGCGQDCPPSNLYLEMAGIG